jgi:hypothetical protein
MKLFVEIFGWYGVAAILGAYALVSFGIIQANDVWYQLLNLSGAAGLLLVSVYKQVWQPVATNAVWMLIAFVAILQIIF